MPKFFHTQFIINVVSKDTPFTDYAIFDHLVEYGFEDEYAFIQVDEAKEVSQEEAVEIVGDEEHFIFGEEEEVA
jgi:hypothetical protein